MTRKQKAKSEVSPHISQIDLIAAIVKHLEKQGVSTVLPRQYNAIIGAANSIIREFDIERKEAASGCGLAAWLVSDETGMSSQFMAYMLAGGPKATYRHPLDPSDLMRCLKFQAAVPEALPVTAMAKAGIEWERLAAHWDALKTMLESEWPTGRAPKTYDAMQRVLNGGEP